MDELEWIRIITCNVRGTNTKPDKLQQLYSVLQPSDVLVLTETNLGADTLNISPKHNPPETCSIHTTRHTTKQLGSGVTVITGPAIKREAISHETLIPGYLSSTLIKQPNQDVLILGVYNPPDETHSAHAITTRIADAVNTHLNAHIVITGDLNAGLRGEDRTTLAPPSEQEQIWRRLTRAFDLKDVITQKNPHDKSLFTYTSPQTGSRSRIDHMLTSELLASKCTKSSIEGGIWKPADHYAVMATFNLRKQNVKVFAPTVKRTPTSDLYDEELVLALRAHFSTSQPTKPSHALEAQKAHLGLKEQVSNIITAFTVEKAARERRQLQKLKNRLREVKSKLASSEHEAKRYTQLENRFNKALRMHTEDRLRRTSAILNKQAALPADIPSYTAHRLSQPHAKGTLRNAYALRDPKSGRIRTDTQGMAGALVNFYQTLFTSEQTPTRERDARFLLSQPLYKLTPEEQAELQREPTLEEVETLFSKLKPSKAPGPDGIGNDIYRAFKHEWAPHFLCVIREFQSTQRVLPEFLSAIIAPFYKEKGERENLANWRPVTLLNTDYKLLALFIANRLTPLMQKLVGPGQTSSVPGRTTFDNIHSVRLLQYISTLDERIDTAFLFIDSEKAFDRVEWEYMWSTLHEMNFPMAYIQMIKSLYTGATATVRVNGLRTGAFPLGRGVRQGCPLSPLLYVLTLEPIRNYIHTELARIGGKPQWLPKHIPPSYAHADDLTIFLEAKYAHILLRRLQLYIGPDFLASGMLIHGGKSIIVYMQKDGALKHRNTSTLSQTLRMNEVQVFYVNDENLDLKHLGVPFGGRDPEGRIRESVEKRTEQVIAQIAPSHIPFLEKVRILTSRISGCLQFYAQTIHFDTPTLERLGTKLRDAFYAAHKQHKYMIRDDRLFAPRTLGGAGLLHPRTWCEAFKHNQLVRLHRGFPRPTDHKHTKHTDPSLVQLFKLAVFFTSHTRLQKSFDPSTFFWITPTHRAEIARHMPSYWNALITHYDRFYGIRLYNETITRQGFLKASDCIFPLDAALNTPILTTKVLPEVSDCEWFEETDMRDGKGSRLFYAPLYMCYDTEFTHTFADPNMSLHQLDAKLHTRLSTATQYDFDTALDLILHPAFMMPFVSTKTPPTILIQRLT